ncbi:hypothetical protein BDV28DRAFT_140709, partial [Aspergillus coremiiformis]
MSKITLREYTSPFSSTLCNITSLTRFIICSQIRTTELLSAVLALAVLGTGASLRTAAAASVSAITAHNVEYSSFKKV